MFEEDWMTKKVGEAGRQKSERQNAWQQAKRALIGAGCDRLGDFGFSAEPTLQLSVSAVPCDSMLNQDIAFTKCTASKSAGTIQLFV